MTDMNHEQLISDLVDGQLSPEQIERAQRLIAEDADFASLYESLRGQQAMLKSMPKFSLDDGFANRVVEQANAKGLLDPKQESPSEPLLPAGSADVEAKPKKAVPEFSSHNWMAPAIAIASLAAMLLVTLFLVPSLPMNSVAELNVADSAKLELDDVMDEDESSFDESKSGASQSKSFKSFAEQSEAGGAPAPSGKAGDTFDSKGESADGAKAPEMKKDNLGNPSIRHQVRGISPPTNAASENSHGQPDLVRNNRDSGQGVEKRNPGPMRGGVANDVKEGLEKIVQSSADRSGGKELERVIEAAEQKERMKGRPIQKGLAGRSVNEKSQINQFDGPVKEERQETERQESRSRSAMLADADEANRAPAPPLAGVRRDVQAVNQVWVIKVPEDEDTLRFVNRTLANNGIDVDLPETREARLPKMAMAGESMRQNSEDDQAQDTPSPKRDFAYSIRSTPAQMQKAVMQLSEQAEILAVDLDFNGKSVLNGAGKDGAGIEAFQTEGGQRFREMNADAEQLANQLNTANFGGGMQRKMELEKGFGGGGSGGGGGSAGGGLGGSESSDFNNDDNKVEDPKNQRLANEPAGRFSDVVKNEAEFAKINRFLGLAEDGGTAREITRRSYTLIFMLKKANLAEAVEPAEVGNALPGSDK